MDRHCCVVRSLNSVEHDRVAPLGSDGGREVAERDEEPVAARNFGSDVVVAAAQVLDEGMTGGESPCRAVALQAPHWPQPGFQPSMVCLDRVVRVLLEGVQR